MKTNIATTKEQSAHLLRCGVSADTADMSWAVLSDETEVLTAIPNLAQSEVINYPAWSLSALLGLLPKEIYIDGYKYRISIYFESPDEPVIGNQWCLYYKPKKHNEKSRIDDVPMYAPDLIECSILMIEWLAANGYKLHDPDRPCRKKGGEE